MKKTDEIKNQINAKRAEVEKLRDAGDIEKAGAAADELTALIKALDIEKTLEDSEMKDFEQKATPVTAVKPKDEAAMKNRIFNKLVLGRALDEAERAYDSENAFSDRLFDREFQNAPGTPGQVGATPAKGGYLLPEEQMQRIIEFRRAYTALKDYVNVVPVATRTGKFPTVGTETGTLIKFEELNDINQSDIDFGQGNYAVEDYGDIIPVANQLLQDINIDLISFIGQRFVRKAINTENAEILGLLGGLTQTAITDWKGLAKALNVTLDPAISASARIITNQDGFEIMEEWVDSHQRPLLTESLTNPTRRAFKGREVVVVSNSVLKTPSGSGARVPFYVGSFTDAITFYERRGVEIAVSTEAGFTKYATLIRAVERFQAKMLDSEAVVALGVAV